MIRPRTKEYDELYAKVLLENIFPEMFYDLKCSDKPDLLDEKRDIGIEVVSCASTKENEIFFFWLNENSLSEKQKNAYSKSLKKYRYSNLNGMLLHPTKEYTEDITDIVYKCIFESITKKLEKLNDSYKELNQYFLYIETQISLNNLDLNNFAKKIADLSSKDFARQYSMIFVTTNDNEIIKFDLTNLTFEIRSFNDKQSELARIANKLAGDDNDQT